jgi:hypothetical protein
MTKEKNLYRRKIILGILAVAFYVAIGLACSHGGGAPAVPKCNETTASIKIRVHWFNILNYNGRDMSCFPPYNFPQSPLSAFQNGPNGNDKAKGIVTVTCDIPDNSCTLSKTYSTRQYWNVMGEDDVLAQVPVVSGKSTRITVEYQEACTTCSTITAGAPARAIFKSETTIPSSQLVSGALITLNTPQFFSVNTSSCQ